MRISKLAGPGLRGPGQTNKQFTTGSNLRSLAVKVRSNNLSNHYLYAVKPRAINYMSIKLFVMMPESQFYRAFIRINHKMNLKNTWQDVLGRKQDFA